MAACSEPSPQPCGDPWSLWACWWRWEKPLGVAPWGVLPRSWRAAPGTLPRWGTLSRARGLDGDRPWRPQRLPLDVRSMGCPRRDFSLTLGSERPDPQEGSPSAGHLCPGNPAGSSDLQGSVSGVCRPRGFLRSLEASLPPLGLVNTKASLNALYLSVSFAKNVMQPPRSPRLLHSRWPLLSACLSTWALGTRTSGPPRGGAVPGGPSACPAHFPAL